MKLFLVTVILLSLFSPPTSALAPAGPSHTVVMAAQVNGTWRGSRGDFRVWALGKERLRVEFSGLYEYKTPTGPIANLGEARGIAIIEGAVAVFKPDGTDGRCTITMTFKRGRLLVAEVGECGFGQHVTAAGAYRKVSSRKPRFGARRY